MNNRVVLKFKLFGEFLYSVEGDDNWYSLEDLTQTGIGKKQRAFLVYLLLNHNRKITAAELIEHFWSAEGKSPSNSLKNTLHKTRALLSIMFPETSDLILTQSGGYIWNSDVSIQLDTDLFEGIYRVAKTLPEAERVVQEQEAVALYSGDILPGVSAYWLDHMNTYYRSVFIDICKSLAVLLQEDERWEDVIQICRHAYFMAPEVEEFSVCYMQAFLSSGNPELAIKHYEEYRAMLWQEYGLIPSDRVEKVYTLAVNYVNSRGDFSGELIRQMVQVPEVSKAFQCSLLVFQNFVQMELRNLKRNNNESAIVVLILSVSNNHQSSTDIRRIERVLLYGLRAGDPFTRLNMGEYALLLPGASEENACKVMERIERSFRSTYPRSKARLQYRVFPMKAEG